MICIICGKPAVIDLYCKDCYKKKINQDIFNFSYSVCRNCGKARIEGVWRNPDLIWKNMEKKLLSKFENASIDPKELIAYIYVKDVELDFPIKINIHEELCPECSKIKGGYYEGEIQLRGQKIKKYLKIITSLFDKIDNPYSIQELKEGINIRFFSSKKALESIRSLNIPYKVTTKLHTQIQGKRKYRLTILIRTWKI